MAEINRSVSCSEYKRANKRTSLKRPDERTALSDEGPACAEAEQPDAFVTRTGAKEVANERRPAIVNEAYDGDGGQKRERVLRDPWEIKSV